MDNNQRQTEYDKGGQQRYISDQQRQLSDQIPIYNTNKEKYGKRVVSVIFAAFALIILIFFWYTQSNYKPYSNNDTISIDDTTKINIDANANILVVPTNDSDLKIAIEGKSISNPDYEVSRNGNNINITFNKGIRFGVSLWDLDMTVEVPMDYNGDFSTVTSSGETEFDITNLEYVSMISSSGDIDTDDIICKELFVKASSGEINISSIQAEKVELKTSSGEINIDDIYYADLKAQASSGNINVVYSAFDNDIEIGSSSGEIDLYLPPNSEFQIDAKTSSGNINCDFSVISRNDKDNRLRSKTSTNAENMIQLRASSGNVNINEQ